MKPVGDRVIIEPVAAETQTESGIMLRLEEVTKPNEGIVISAGEDVSCVKSGDHVIFDRYAGSQIRMDGKDLLIMSYRDIAAVIE